MINPSSKKKHGLFVLGAGCLLLGGFINVAFINSYMIRSLGLALLVAGVFLVKTSGIRGIKGAYISNSEAGNVTSIKRPGWLSLLLSLSSGGAIVISYLCMQKDAIAGGHESWPAYAFAASVLVAAVVWGYVVAKLVQR